MEKDCKCGISLLAIAIIVFSFWQINLSKWIIVASAAVILLVEILLMFKSGCSCVGKICVGGHKTGEEIFLEKNPKSEYPTKKELEEVMKKPAKKSIAKKVVAKK